MILLALESATDAVGAALLRDGDGDGVAERVHQGGRAHAEHLVPAIEEVCALAGCRVGDIDRIAVDVGPGLFTGLRVGVATAKALGQALGAGVLGVTSLDVLAAAARQRTGPAGGPVVAVVDARRGEVFAAAYLFGDGLGEGDQAPDPAAHRHDCPGPVTPEALRDWLRDRLGDLATDHSRVTVVGDGALRYRHLLAPGSRLDLALAGELRSPSPLCLAHLARRRLASGARASDPAEVVPDYRRAADARINWEQRIPTAAGDRGGEAGGPG